MVASGAVLCDLRWRMEAVLSETHDVVAGLPPLQRRPLALALLLEDADRPAPDRRAIGVALLAALRALARERRVLVALDDVQWLDTSSAAALAFAVRRSTHATLSVLMTERTGTGTEQSVLRARARAGLAGA